MTFYIGLIGSIILVSGAAYPARALTHPIRSLKNWLFALGGLAMLIYSILNYIAGGLVFFVFLQVLVSLASILMLSNVREDKSGPVILGLAAFMVVWSLSLIETYTTVFFIIGLGGIAFGYILKAGTSRRNLALFAGSVLIALFSYIEASWIFFWLNVFFALFSGYYAWKLRKN